jgi:hypothetical protein
MNIHFDFSAAGIKRMIFTFLHRFHVMIFVIIVLGGVIVMVLLLNSIVLRSSESNGYTSDTNNATFDQATIKRIDELKTRDQTSDQLDLSTGRTNPFVE